MWFLYIMLWVNNLEKFIEFYCDVFGMKLLCKKDYFGGEFILVFVGYGDELNYIVLELIYNWDIDKYDLGNVYGYIVLGVDDIYSICEKIKE